MQYCHLRARSGRPRRCLGCDSDILSTRNICIMMFNSKMKFEPELT